MPHGKDWIPSANIVRLAHRLFKNELVARILKSRDFTYTSDL